MMTVKEVREWLDTLDETDQVGVDEGGLALIVFPGRETGDTDDGGDEYPWLELGGIPEGEDDERDYPHVRQTTCQHCGLDIEGVEPFVAGEWHDRGNETRCHCGPNAGKPHRPEEE